MDAKQLNYFLVIAEERSFSKAAQKCFISQQALSKTIINLEKELNCTLFIRGANGAEITEAGKKLRKHAIAYLNYHNKIMEEMKQKEDEQEKEFVLGYATGMLQQFSDSFLSRFIMKYPDIQFKVVSYPDDSYNRSLLNYQLDVSFCSMITNPQTVKILYHYAHKAFLLIGKNHPLAEKEKILAEDLKDFDFITMNNDTDLNEDVDTTFKKFKFRNQISISPSEYDFCYQLLLTGKYASFYATHYKDPLHRLVKKEIDFVDIEYNFYIVTQIDTVVTPLMRDLVESVKYELEKPL